MAKSRIALLSMGAALLCGIGAAQAQDINRTESVTAYPYHIQVERAPGPLLSVPLELSISRQVSTAGLDLSREADAMELRHRVRDTARELCAELDVRFPALIGRDRECVRNATRDAMRSVYG